MAIPTIVHRLNRMNRKSGIRRFNNYVTCCGKIAWRFSKESMYAASACGFIQTATPTCNCCDKETTRQRAGLARNHRDWKATVQGAPQLHKPPPKVEVEINRLGFYDSPAIRKMKVLLPLVNGYLVRKCWRLLL